jgi:site-specific recombinase XerD
MTGRLVVWRKTALTAALVTRVVKAIPGDTVAGLLDRALLLLQFSAALLVSELVDLKVNDVARHSEGIVLTIKRSKTDQEGIGLQKAVPYGKRLRPVPALDAMKALMFLMREAADSISRRLFATAE